MNIWYGFEPIHKIQPELFEKFEPFLHQVNCFTE